MEGGGAIYFELFLLLAKIPALLEACYSGSAFFFPFGFYDGISLLGWEIFFLMGTTALLEVHGLGTEYGLIRGLDV